MNEETLKALKTVVERLAVLRTQTMSIIEECLQIKARLEFQIYIEEVKRLVERGGDFSGDFNLPERD